MTKKSDNPQSLSKRTTLRSILAVLLGLVAVYLLPLGTNLLVRSLDAFPYGSPELALIYRSVCIVLGSYLTARFAPSRPMQHALILGSIYFIYISTSTIIVIPMQFFGPSWYYIGLVITTLPCAWLGGILHRRFHHKKITNAE